MYNHIPSERSASLMQPQSNTHTQIHSHTHTNTHDKHTHIHTHTHTYIHTHTHTHTHMTYTHTYWKVAQETRQDTSPSMCSSQMIASPCTMTQPTSTRCANHRQISVPAFQAKCPYLPTAREHSILRDSNSAVVLIPHSTR